ncbi:NAD(P)-dependent dehydrogenase (short-subunit alcohol dehydrogenase family) [Allocatelliglobosispora scoriae]|uniref:NAD(P)-dependent dehydrogenase (Short-subunit alcohol dehydrogenase family) n=1 Tax=Allocatelliglobosispora scoriae TaxID=643052 RepID=A0A841C226_9ACTN|nr:SDR family oxidoreductase [Allocatelliglobosispora scoriae]MBB5873112.1 NAD(P)-dependent dehydrogenase (short-subunit alcohol dehydrogenase family) [Allocatelliglobosispora scoriae]
MAQRWLITGCSSGLGRALAIKLAEAGEKVIATARRPETIDDLARRYSGTLVTGALDVREPAQCQAAVDLAVDCFGGVDVLVNNAGYGQFGAVEEVSDAELAAQFETNVFGPWRLTRAVLPLWREQESGHAIFVSSLAGFMPFPGLAAYTSSKFALEGLAESLAVEAAHLGVRVTIMQPGGFATAYGDSLVEPDRHVVDYEPAISGMLVGLRGIRDLPAINEPELFAEVVLRVARMQLPPLRLPVGPESETYLSAVYAARLQEFEAMTKAGHHVAR